MQVIQVHNRYDAVFKNLNKGVDTEHTDCILVDGDTFEALVIEYLDSDKYLDNMEHYKYVRVLKQPPLETVSAICSHGGFEYIYTFRKTTLKKFKIVDIVVEPLIEVSAEIRGKGQANSIFAIIGFCYDSGSKTEYTQLISFDNDVNHVIFNNKDSYDERFCLKKKFDKDAEIPDMNLYLLNIVRFYIAVMNRLINKPEVVRKVSHLPKTSGNSNKQPSKTQQQKKRSTVRMLRVKYDGTIVVSEEKNTYTRTCKNWGVQGHYRHYKKSGKTIWINPYHKGEERLKDSEYKPKNYDVQPYENATIPCNSINGTLGGTSKQGGAVAKQPSVAKQNGGGDAVAKQPSVNKDHKGSKKKHKRK